MRFLKNKWVVVGLLALAYAFSFADRYLMNVLAESIKHDLHLSDTQMSLLMGFGFAVFYATLGIPIGILSDRVSRRSLMAIGIALWSIMTSICGLAQNYFQLLLARMGIGVGEAALSPSAYSILADYFPKRQLATALSIYSLGIYVGCGLAFLLGSRMLVWMHDIHWYGLYPWQWIFIGFGLTGLLVSLGLCFIHEPKRLSQASMPLHEFKLFLLSKGSPYIWICIASAFFNVAVYAISTWLPSYLTRVHQLSTPEIGNIMGIATLLLPTFGIVLGGKWSDKRSLRLGVYGRVQCLLLLVLALIPVCLVLTLAPSLSYLWPSLVLYSLLVSAGVGTTAAIVQELVPEHQRGIATATLLFAQNLIGMGLGPTAVALLTDYYFVNELAIGKSLMVISMAGLLLSGFCFLYSIQKLKVQK